VVTKSGGSVPLFQKVRGLDTLGLPLKLRLWWERRDGCENGGWSGRRGRDERWQISPSAMGIQSSMPSARNKRRSLVIDNTWSRPLHRQVLSTVDWWPSLVYHTGRCCMCRGEIFKVQSLGQNSRNRPTLIFGGTLICFENCNRPTRQWHRSHGKIFWCGGNRVKSGRLGLGQGVGCVERLNDVHALMSTSSQIQLIVRR